MFLVPWVVRIRESLTDFLLLATYKILDFGKEIWCFLVVWSADEIKDR
jgi:hypothetical protein